MLTQYVLFAVITYFAQYVQCGGHYSLVGSKEIRPNADYHVSVTVHESTKPYSMLVGIKDDAGTVITSQKVTVQSCSTKLMDFKTGALTPGTNYKLFAEGLKGMVFKNETDLNLNEKSFSVLIQTDKAIYKPGDLIQFRVLVLDSNMRAAVIQGDMTVYIMDGKSNRIKQWLNAVTVKGVFSQSLQLSDSPVLGDWTINVDVMGETNAKTVEVAEYVLPKFDVTIETPSTQIYKNGKIMATIKAIYTYGKGVKGQATVTIQPSYGGTVLSQKTVPIDGKGNVEFDIKTDMNINDGYDQDFDIVAVVEEELTGITRTATFTVTVYRYAYKIILIENVNQYKPGLPFIVNIQVANQDGTPIKVTSKTNKLTLTYGQDYNGEKKTSKQFTLNSHGMVTISFVIPAKYTGFYVQATYLDLVQDLGFFSPATSESGQYIQARLLTKNPSINMEVCIEVKATEMLEHFTYQVLGRGDVLLSDTVYAYGGKTVVFEFMPSFSMVPAAQLIVYYIKDGKMVSHKLEIDFRNELQNTITVTASSLNTKPGDNITLSVVTNPNSYVGIMGIDQSVSILKTGNDLSKDDVFDQLAQYNQQYFKPTFGGAVFRGFLGGGFSGGGFEDFDNANAVILTNACEPERIFYALDFESVDAAVPATAGAIASTTIRKDFPETWIWYSRTESFNGHLTLHETVPDTITSWIITGFSIDPVTGLGLTESPTKVTVFLPFFISLNLPYSIKHGEIALIQAIVFNYMEQDVVAQVTLHNDDQEFEFVNPSKEDTANDSDKAHTIEVAVKSNDGASAFFMIKPNKVGPLTIKVTATSPLAGDGIERILPVEPEGTPQYVNKALFIDLRETTSVTSTMSIDIPTEAVPGSTRVSVSVIGDILGITQQNLDSLINMPSGCGEQNMLSFVPDIVVYEYLENTNQLTASIEGKLIQYMESGYQRELTYKHTDNSFSAFGDSDASGSTWLTAFVCRSFMDASDFIYIEQKIIDDGLTWLSAVQIADGSFPEVGNVIHTDMQGGSAHGLPLTAYVLITFLEHRIKTQLDTYLTFINKAQDYIMNNQAFLDDTYSLALVAYAFQLSGHPSKDLMLANLEAKATNDGDQRYWSKPIPASQSTNAWYERPNSVNVEMTAYAMLAEMKAGHFTDALPILRWLLAQRNEQGGFQSTQDTCVGLAALAEFAKGISSAASNVQLTVTYSGGSQIINLNQNNANVLQQYELPSTILSIDISASGNGFALFSLSYQYNVMLPGEFPRFTLNPTVDANSNSEHLYLTICTSFVPAEDGSVSNMAVMEIEFPSGFTFATDTLEVLKATPKIKQVETANGDTKLILYIDNVSDTQMCVNVEAIRSSQVAEQKPVAVIIFDYYDTTKKARAFYSITPTSVCDICGCC